MLAIDLRAATGGADGPAPPALVADARAGLAALRQRAAAERVVVIGTTAGAAVAAACAAADRADGIVLVGRRLYPEARPADLDVFEAEPMDAAHPIRALALPNVVVTPHLAWLTPETLTRSLDVAFENCRRVRDREPLVHAVLDVTRS